MRRWLRERWYRLRRRLRSLPRPRRRKKPGLTRQEADALFSDEARCRHCGCWHDAACPRVKRISFRGSEVASVEFWEWRPQDWDRWTRERNRAVTLVTRSAKEAMIGDE